MDKQGVSFLLTVIAGYLKAEGSEELVAGMRNLVFAGLGESSLGVLIRPVREPLLGQGQLSLVKPILCIGS